MKGHSCSAVVLLLVICLLVSGCGLVSRLLPDWGDEPVRSGGSGSGKPYTVRGQTYYPYTSAKGYVEEGTASWYGPGFHGNTTANGERYNQNALTAAHKLLPFNTTLKVTNLENGRSVQVRVNDRGPFVDNRVIDLSKKAAQQIGMIQKGTARVRLEATGADAPVLTADGDMSGRFYVQIGAFSVAANASKLMQTIKKTGLGGRILHNRNTGLRYVQVGPWRSLLQARAILQQLASRYPGLFVVAE